MDGVGYIVDCEFRFHKTFITIFSHLNKRDYFVHVKFSMFTLRNWNEMLQCKNSTVNIFSTFIYSEWIRFNKIIFFFSAHAIAIVFDCVNYGLKTIAIIYWNMFFLFRSSVFYTHAVFKWIVWFFLVFWSIIFLFVQWHQC